MLQTNISLSQRIYRSKYSQSAGVGNLQQTCDHASSSRMVNYKEWTYDKMDKAIQAVIDDGLSIRQAAEEFNVPKSTLGDRISGRTLHGAKSGRSKYLTDEEEDILVRFLLKCAAIGYPRSRNEVIAMVQRFCDSRDMNVHVTHGWWERFCFRHPEISLRTTSALSYARVKGQNEEALSSYFDILEDTFSEHKLHDKPALVFNMDETGLPLSPVPLKGVCKRSTKTPNSITSGDKSQITIVGCVNAAGHCIPPMIIWDRKTLHADMTKGELPGTIYGLSSKGWADQELFQIWFEFHFLRYAPPIRPILLLMDGHSSHYCPDTVFLAAKEKVILFTLPPNTTHLTQPLDKGCFGPLKNAWRKACHDFMAENPGKVVSRYSFCSVFAIAWLQAMSMKNIIAGFKVTGIFPIDRYKLVRFESPALSLLQSVDPAYIPMLSPTPHKKIATSNQIAFSDSQHELHYEKPQLKDDIGSAADNGEEKKSRDMLWKDMYFPYEFPCDENSKKSTLPISSLCSAVCTPKKATKPCTDSETAVVLYSKRSMPIEKMLKYPSPIKTCNNPVSKCTPTKNYSSRVLTSSENLAILEEKQRKKAEELKKKEDRLLKKNQKGKGKTATNLSKSTTLKDKESTSGNKVSSTPTTAVRGMDLEEPDKQYKVGKKQKCVTSVSSDGSKDNPLMISDKSPIKDENDWWIQNLKLKESDQALLLNGSELNDNLINAAHCLLSSQFSEFDGFQNTILAHHLKFRPVSNSTLSIQILHAGSSNHWICTSRMKSSTVVQVMDSLSNSGVKTSLEILLQIAKIYPAAKSILQINRLSVQQQVGIHDCGLFSIAYAVETCYRNDVQKSLFDQKSMRKHLHDCFNNGVLTPFSKQLKSQSVLYSVYKVERFKVYCSCKMPEEFDTKMILCDQCHTWFHYKCVNLKLNQHPKTWKCPSHSLI